MQNQDTMLAPTSSSAVTSRQREAIAEYLICPNTCEHCSEPIVPKGRETAASMRMRRFCSLRCAGLYAWKATHPDFDPRAPKCRTCDQPARKQRKGGYAKWCSECRPKSQRGTYPSDMVAYVTKARAKRYGITYHAETMMCDVPRICAHCGYDKHVEIAHVKPVSSFPQTALLLEINSRSNLLHLCPNCHWEFDHPSGG